MLEKNRNPSYITTTATGAAYIEKILDSRRLELWGEGKSYLAMKRKKAAIKRGPNHLFFGGQTFSYDDDRLSMDIPQAEINNNPKLK
ncbi:RagB/SusD family nutrient uptake outer membrane protein [Kaistella yananensis]|uniref:RagB/SusD family nutrient uptake outer membrane protein n=1 Tax=Kaistella yananensis TaxID=2989820 RepID=UPI0038B2A91A